MSWYARMRIIATVAISFLLILKRFDSSKELLKRIRYHLTATAGRLFFRDYVNVPLVREKGSVDTEELAHKALDAVAGHGIAHLSTDCDAYPGALAFSFFKKYGKIAVRKLWRVRHRMDEFRSLEQSVGFGESMPA